jgi:hypothetical protein
VRHVIFDLDGTIALCDHRRYLSKVHWPSFERSCVTDQPNVPVVLMLRALYRDGWQTSIWSARSERVRGYTEDWLILNGIKGSYHELRMRPINDSRDDAVLKEEWLKSLTSKPDIVFDDRDKVVAMWRRNQIVCAQVAPGDF